MNFFKSILSDEPDPVTMNSHQKSGDDILNHPTSSSGESHGGGGDDVSGGLWSFGDLVKNLTAKSESVFETDEGDDGQVTDSNLTDDGENDVSENDVGLWSFGDLVKNLTNRSESEDYQKADDDDVSGMDKNEEQLRNSNSDSNYSGENDASDDVSGGGFWSFGDLVKTITTKSESVLETYSPNHQNEEAEEQMNLNSDVRDDVSGGGLWRFGDLVKNLTNKSESVLETYRRDLKEFGSGLKKESDLFREVANRAVKELPETMKKSISQGKNADVNVDANDADVNRVYYSRFDAQLNVLQNDVETYCKDPEDNLDEYRKWKLEFVLSENESEIEKLIGENGSVEAIYMKVVPSEVDEGSFWCRYFYKVYKLKQQEDVRASFVRRSLNVDDEEELSWDVDDDEDEIEEETDLREIEWKRNLNDESKTVTDHDMKKNNDSKLSGGNVSDEKADLVPSKNAGNDVSNDKVELVLKTDENHDISENAAKDTSNDKVELVLKKDENHDHSENAGKEVCDEKVESVLKTDENLDNSKSAESSFQEEEDLEWDEIGDIGDNDEKNVSQNEITPNKGEVLKRLNNTVEDDDEDLSWDIEDDDEPVKDGSSK